MPASSRASSSESFKFLGQHFGRAFDHSERIANLMRQACRQLTQRRQSFRSAGFRLCLSQAPIGLRQLFGEVLVEPRLATTLLRKTVHQHGREKEKHDAQHQQCNPRCR